jgi:hypothetical protein
LDMTDSQQPVKIGSLSIFDLNKKVDELFKSYNKDYSAEDVEDVCTEISDASKEYDNFSWDTVQTALHYLDIKGVKINATKEMIHGIMNWIEACNNITDISSIEDYGTVEGSNKLVIDWEKEYRNESNVNSLFSENAKRNDIESKYITDEDTGYFYFLGHTVATNLPEKIGKFALKGVSKVIIVADVLKDLYNTYQHSVTRATFEEGGTLWPTKKLSEIYAPECYQLEDIGDVYDAITTQSLTNFMNSYMEFYGATLTSIVKGTIVTVEDMKAEYEGIVNEAKLAALSQKMAILSDPDLTDQIKSARIKQIDSKYGEICSVCWNEMLCMDSSDFIDENNQLTEFGRQSMNRSLGWISQGLNTCLFGDLFPDTGGTFQRPNINMLAMKDSYKTINTASEDIIAGLGNDSASIEEQKIRNAKDLSCYATALFHDRFPDLEKKAGKAIDALYRYQKEMPNDLDDVNRYANYSGFLHNYFSEEELLDIGSYLENIYAPYISYVPDKQFENIKESYIASNSPMPLWIKEMDKMKELTVILGIATAPMEATQSYIESGNKAALRVFGLQPDENAEGYANGGRADEASIFGEAGPEWAIPERHNARTAELLNSAREASGFSWTELIASTGGLNGGGNVVNNNITYAPVVHANDARGMEDALSKDKQLLDDWWKQKQWELARTQWA